MPYATNADLPSSVRDVLPEEAQTIYREAFNAALEQSEDEAAAASAAWAAVEMEYEQDAEGNWNVKAAAPVADPVAAGKRGAMKRITKTKGGDWKVSGFDPPLQLSIKRFPTKRSVELWLDSTNCKEFVAHRAKRVSLARKTKPIHRRVRFQDEMVGTPEGTPPPAGTPGEPANPDMPRPDESLEGLADRIMAAFTAAGWNGFDNPDAQYDFGLQETYTDFVIAQDYKTMTLYKIPFTDNGETVTFGQPEEYTVSYKPASEPSEPAPPTAPSEPTSVQASLGKTRIRGKAVVLSSKGTDKQGNPKYEMILCQSGETGDGRFVTDECVQGAVDAGLWDGARSYLSHPDPDTGKRTSEIACALVVPSTVRAQKNDSGHLDVIGQVVVFNTKDGRDVAEALDMGLEYKTAVIGTSVFSESAFKRQGEVNGRNYTEIIERFEHIDAQDFVTDPAFSRATAQSRVAASRTDGNGDELTMAEREELVALRAENATLKDKVALNQREKDVKAELSKSGLDAETQAILKPLLMDMDKPSTRTATIALHRRTMLSGVRSGGTGGGPQDGHGNGDPALADDEQAALDRNAERFGIKPEYLEKVRKNRQRVAV